MTLIESGREHWKGFDFDAAFVECPSCHGTGRVQYDGKYSYGLDEETNTVPCRNCIRPGDVDRTPLGYVRKRKDGTPCIHEYVDRKITSSFYERKCIHCGEQAFIDSGS